MKVKSFKKILTGLTIASTLAISIPVTINATNTNKVSNFKTANKSGWDNLTSPVLSNWTYNENDINTDGLVGITLTKLSNATPNASSIEGIQIPSYFTKDGTPLETKDGAYYITTRLGQTWTENPNWTTEGMIDIDHSGNSNFNNLKYFKFPQHIQSIGCGFLQAEDSNAKNADTAAHIDLSQCHDLAAGDNYGICEYAFSYATIGEFIAPPADCNLSYIGDDAFEYGNFYCPIDFSKNLTIKTLGHWSFSNFADLNDATGCIKIPSSVNHVTWAAFSGLGVEINGKTDELYWYNANPKSIKWDINVPGIFFIDRIKEFHCPKGSAAAWQKQFKSFWFNKLEKIVDDI